LKTLPLVWAAAGFAAARLTRGSAPAATSGRAAGVTTKGLLL